MDLRAVWEKLEHWFSEPVSPVPLGLYRILFGLICLANAAFLAPDIFVWFSDTGIFSHVAALKTTPGFRLNLFMISSSDAAALTIFILFVVSSVFTTLGLFTRAATFVLFVTLTSLHVRNVFILSSADTLTRVMAFFLMLSPCGKALSLDLRRTGKRHELVSPTAMRMMQLQLCIVYLATGILKTTGNGMWVDGTAVYVVNQIDQFRRFPVPEFMHSLWYAKFMSWYTIGIELAAPFLIWFRETRLLTLAGLLVLHLGLEYVMTIQLFQFVITSIFVLFLNEREIMWGLKKARLA